MIFFATYTVDGLFGNSRINTIVIAGSMHEAMSMLSDRYYGETSWEIEEIDVSSNTVVELW